jgi:hypothetical protein
MTRTDLALVSSALLALGACQAARQGPPRPQAVEPASGFAAAPTAVEIRGEGFSLRPVQRVDGSGSRAETAHRAWLGATELEEVEWAGPGRLAAIVPAGMAPGLHDLVVEGPFGRGTLPRAFEVLAGAPAVLRVELDAPARVSVGQRFLLALRVVNAGDAALADVTPALALGGAGRARLDGPAAAAVALAPGEAAAFAWTAEALASGDVQIGADAAAVDPRRPSVPVRAATAGAVRVEGAARLEATLEAAPVVVNEGQELLVRLAVRNVGEATALDVAPEPLVPSGDGAAALVSGPLPASASLPAGSTVWFEWRQAATRRGLLALAGGAAGVDANSGAAVRAPALGLAGVQVLAPAALGVRLDAPARVNVGQTFEVALAVQNAGESAAAGVALDVSLSPASVASAGAAPAAFDLPGGATATVARTFTGAATGTATLTASAAGTDSTDARAVSASAPGHAVVVERPAELSATIAIQAPFVLSTFTVTMTVVNAGDAVADEVLPGPLAFATGSTAAATLVAAPAAAASIPGGGAASFTWTYRGETVGSLGFVGSVTGTDRNDGTPRSAQAVSSLTTVRETVRVLATDPFSDGSRFAFVAGHQGKLHVGPSRTGTGLVRMGLDGTAPESVGLSFLADTTASNVSANTAKPYRSIGYTGCQTNSLANACGPDNEDGRGLLTSVTFGGEEWLVLGGAKGGGDLDYVYLARGTASPLELWYVDLSLALGGNTRGFSAAHVAGNRLYLGFPDNGGNRPYGLALLAPPAAPGRDAVLGTHVLDLNLGDAFKKTGGGYASIAMVDTFAELAGRLYAFSDVGCIVSTSATPATKDDFVSCSPPVSPSYDEKQSIEPTRQFDLEPRERAWPQAAVWRGRLYAIRNTYAGPQLWRCDPANGADPVACEPGDWGLVAGDAANLTRFGYTTATAASLLVATPEHLYVGLDDAVRGIHLFRTSVDRPVLASDFSGRDDCTAGSTGCQGFGGDGLGEPSVLHRIFDAKTIPSADGRSDLYLTAGDGSAPVRVLALPQ